MQFEQRDVEAGAWYAAARVLLVGLRHIQEHRMSSPIGITPEQWFDEIVPELIWLFDFALNDKVVMLSDKDRDRWNKAQHLLGEHFFDIWC